MEEETPLNNTSSSNDTDAYQPNIDVTKKTTSKREINRQIDEAIEKVYNDFCGDIQRNPTPTETVDIPEDWTATELERLLNAVKKHGTESEFVLQMVVKTKSVEAIKSKLKELRKRQQTKRMETLVPQIASLQNDSVVGDDQPEHERNIMMWADLISQIQINRNHEDISSTCLQQVLRYLASRSKKKIGRLDIPIIEGVKPFKLEFHRIYTWLACVLGGTGSPPTLSAYESAIVLELLEKLLEEAVQLDATKQWEYLHSVARSFYAGEFDLTSVDFDASNPSEDVRTINPLCVPANMLEFSNENQS